MFTSLIESCVLLTVSNSLAEEIALKCLGMVLNDTRPDVSIPNAIHECSTMTVFLSV